MVAPVSLIVSAFAPVARRAQDLDAAAAHRSRRDVAVARRSRAPARNRLGGSSLAQVHGALGATPPDLDDPQLLTQSRRGAGGAARAGPGARLSRPLRWRRVRDAGRDGLRGPLRARRQTTRRRQWRRGRAVQRRAGRGAAGEGATQADARAVDVRAPRARRAHRMRIGAPDARDARAHRSGHAAASTRAWEDLRRAWSETSFRMRELRDEPALRARRIRGGLRHRRAGPQRRAHLRSERRHLRAVHRHGAARRSRCCASRA